MLHGLLGTQVCAIRWSLHLTFVFPSHFLSFTCKIPLSVCGVIWMAFAVYVPSFAHQFVYSRINVQIKFAEYRVETTTHN
jgi:hypothetical protein